MYKLTVRILDALLEEDMVQHLPKSRIGCFVQVNDKFVDAIMIKEGAATPKPDSITVTLDESQNGKEPKVVFIVKDIQEDEPYVGSVSVPRTILLEGKLDTTYTQWITLFDDQGDDEYDGAMGLNDDEEPRILFEMTMTHNNTPRKDRKARAAEAQQAHKQVSEEPKPEVRKSAEKSYMKPIHNLKGQKGRDPSPEKAIA